MLPTLRSRRLADIAPTDGCGARWLHASRRREKVSVIGDPRAAKITREDQVVARRPQVRPHVPGDIVIEVGDVATLDPPGPVT